MRSSAPPPSAAPQRGDELAAPCVLFRLELSGDGALSLTRLEGRSEAILGVSIADALADPADVLSRIHPADRAALAGALRDSALGQPPTPLRFRMARQLGSASYDLRLVTWACDRSGSRVRWDGAIVECPDSPLPHSAQSLRVLTQMMQTDRLASLGTMAAGMAHEINNPLAYLTANLTFLAEELERLRPEGHSEEWSELEDAVAESREGVVRVRDIVRQLRRFSRVDDEPARPLDLGEVLDGAVRMAWNELRQRVRFESEYRGRVEIRANEAQLAQVFLNLLANAAQSVRERDRDDRVVRLTMRGYDTRAEIAVSDTGAGMRPDIVAKIFDPFFTTKPVGSGTGLGLSVSHSIITGLGGTIAVDSEPARGTTLTVALPATTMPAPHVDPAAVLVLENELRAFEPLQRALRGHALTFVWTPEQALATARAARYDAFLWAVAAPDEAKRVYEALAPWPESLAEHSVLLVPAGSDSEAWSSLPFRVAEKPIDAAVLNTLLRGDG